MVFFAIMVFFLCVIIIPLAAMYAAGQFVGQKPPHQVLKLAVTVAVGVGLLMAVANVATSSRLSDMLLKDWLILAWVVGSALTGQIALLELLGRKSNVKASEG